VLINWVAGTVSSRTVRWLLLVLWLVLAAVAGSVESKLISVENKAQTWLPGGAQSRQALNLANEHFGSADMSDGVIVYPRAAGLTGLDYQAAPLPECTDWAGQGAPLAPPGKKP